MLFFRLAFLFMFGSVGGWVLELFFRRIFSAKKWINPGFLNGPYLPMYGCGTMVLYGACFLPLPRWALVLLLLVALTLLEYVTGLIFIKGLKIKLWDYSDRWGNLQGIVCPLFSLLWGCIAAGFVYLLFEPLQAAAAWAAGSVWFIFLIGAFYGVFLADLCISFNVSLKIRKAAAQFKEAVHYEKLKAAINERRAARKLRRRFLFPFAGASLSDAVRDMLERQKERLRVVSAAVRRKKADDSVSEEDNVKSASGGDANSVSEEDNVKSASGGDANSVSEEDNVKSASGGDGDSSGGREER